MFQRSYYFNPFMMKTASDDDLARQLNDLAGRYIYEENMITISQVVFNINLESDMLMIYGEYIARYQEKVSRLKMDADSRERKQIYELLKNFISISTEKPPGIEYFRAEASDIVKDIRKEQYEAESMLTRFKKAYTSLETKQNALKKKLEAMRYEGR